ncbi:MAG: ATP-binding protein [Sphaerochaetaceae bacterium]|nr:ATP-binding protein [Sphaerochaetaceae bacterium]
MLKRKIEKNINDWIMQSNKSLLIYGVRQAGKTFIIRECLKKSNCDYVEFNLIKQPEIINIIDQTTNIDDLILKLSLVSRKNLIPNKTFIFFDEIQKYKDIVTKIKFLTEDKRFRFILSGSLLGVEITNLKSAPVGYLESISMFPLDFEEFIQIFNIDESIIYSLKQSFFNKKPVDDLLHKKLIDIVNLYLIIGGMPAAVEEYRKTSNIDNVIREHRAIISQYKIDFTQYEAEDKKLIISQIYDKIPAELNEKNKRFMFSDISKNLRYERVSDSFTWLWKSGVALSVFNVTEPVIPLILNEKSSLFKVFLSDIGLLTTIYGKKTKLLITQNAKDINKGSIYENFVAQELIAHGYPLYFYNNRHKGELDFIIEHYGNVMPIEVKSGKDYERHSALDNILKVEEYNIKEAIVFSNSNIKVCDNVIYYPIYMVMFLKNDDILFPDISLEKYKIR